MTLQVLQAAPVDADIIRLCADDIQEILDVTGVDEWRGVTRESIRASFWARSVWENGDCIAIFGVVASPEGLHPWILHDERFRDHPRTLMRWSRVVLKQLLADGRPVWGLKNEGPPRVTRYLEALGFQLEYLGGGITKFKHVR